MSNAFAWLFNGNYKLDKGNGLEDQPQRFVVAWIWQPTFTHRSGAFFKYFVNNWQLSSLTTINSSRPYASPTVSLRDTPVVAGTLGAGVPGMFSNFSLNGSGLSGRVPFLPVDSVYQPALYKTDARVSKIIPLGPEERYKFLVSFEAFNITNSWSPTSMSTQAYTPNPRGPHAYPHGFRRWPERLNVARRPRWPAVYSSASGSFSDSWSRGSAAQFPGSIKLRAFPR